MTAFDRKGLRSAPRSTLAALLAGLALAGCAVPPLAQRDPPAVLLPTRVQTGVMVDARWWTAFGDPQLDRLVDEALAHNLDLARAAARIAQSRALLSGANAERLPRVDASVSSGRQRVTQTAAGTVPGVPLVGSDHRAAIEVSYEVDLWSRLANGEAAARAELLASTFARDTLRVALAAQVVQAYASLQALEAQLALFQRSVQAARDSLSLQQRRYAAGDIGELDMRQLEGELLAYETQLPKLQRERDQTQRALALVLGRSPRALIDGSVAYQPLPAVGVEALKMPSALPSDLLAHRPDVHAAEERLRAAGARVDVARAAYFPQISLSAGLGRESAELSKLTDGASLIWGVLASLTQPIWDGGRIAARNDLVRAQQRELEIDYRDTVAVAFKEAGDALDARGASAQRLALAIDRQRVLAAAVRLTRLRFEGGEESRIELIRAQRVDLAAQSEVLDARRALAVAQADVFRALGGGWSPPGDGAAMASNSTAPAAE